MTTSKRKDDEKWLLLSLLLHLLLGATLWFTPIRQFVLPQQVDAGPEVRLAPRQIEQIAQQMQLGEQETITEMVRELQAVQERLNEQWQTKQHQYDELSREQLLTAPERALAAQQQAIEIQAEALEDVEWATEKLQAAVVPPTDELTELVRNEDRNEAAGTQNMARESQGRVGEAQREVARALAFAGAEYDDARTAQEEATAKQEEASQRQDEARTALYEHKWAVPAVPHGERRLADAEKRVERHTQAHAGLVKALTDAKTTLAKLAVDKSAAMQKRVDSLQARVATERKRLNEATEAVVQQTQSVADAKKRTEDLETQAIKAQPEAITLQMEAREAQSKARTALARVVANATAPTQSADSATTPPPAPVQVDAHMTVPVLYEAAVTTEQQLTEVYRQVRATDTAIKTVVPLAETLSRTKVETPPRPKLTEIVFEKPVTSLAGAAELRAHMEHARKTVADMVRNARRLEAVIQARGAMSATGMAVSLASIRAEAASEAELKDLAREDAAVRYKDLSAAMRARDPSASEAKGGGHMPDLIAPSPNVPPARRIGVTSGPAPSSEWISVNTWYVIGPFPNPARRNIDTQFPPELVIDLDATYEGKDGRTIKWEFWQCPRARISPPHDEPDAIYYAYTDLWFEESVDLTIAVGSDDYSRLWINGMLVWMSGKQRKSWRPDEGYRTVHFRKGLNRVLYRIENGAHGSVYSLMIRVGGSES